jgi:hypothetical protein
MRTATLLLALLLGSGTARVVSAEVRVEVAGGDPSLVVRPIAGGVWAPAPHSSGAELLNPSGDLRGDGWPSIAANGESPVAAWSRNSAGALVTARVDATGRIDQQLTPIVGTVDQLIVRAGENCVLVAWSDASTSSTWGLLVLEDGRRTAAFELQAGRLVDVVPTSSAFVTVSVGGQRVIATAIAYLPIEPLPIPTQLASFTIRSADTGVEPCVEPRGETVLIAWPAGRGTVGYVRVGLAMSSPPACIRGAQGSCKAILSAIP